MLRVEPVAAGSGLRVAGEVDASVHDRWRSSLDWAVGQGRDVHLDLSELRFIDGRGVALLVAAARRLPQGRWMVLHWPPSSLRQALEVLWPDDRSTIAVKDERADS
jgi:anti-anti-sigma factor